MSEKYISSSNFKKILSDNICSVELRNRKLATQLKSGDFKDSSI